jgi:hypothetical protein
MITTLTDDKWEFTWREELPPEARRTTACAILSFGLLKSIRVEQRADGQCWLYATFPGLSWGAWVPGDLAEGKRVALQVLTERLIRALAEFKEATGQ